MYYTKDWRSRGILLFEGTTQLEGPDCFPTLEGARAHIAAEIRKSIKKSEDEITRLRRLDPAKIKVVLPFT